MAEAVSTGHERIRRMERRDDEQAIPRKMLSSTTALARALEAYLDHLQPSAPVDDHPDVPKLLHHLPSRLKKIHKGVLILNWGRFRTS